MHARHSALIHALPRNPVECLPLHGILKKLRNFHFRLYFHRIITRFWTKACQIARLQVVQKYQTLLELQRKAILSPQSRDCGRHLGRANRHGACSERAVGGRAKERERGPGKRNFSFLCHPRRKSRVVSRCYSSKVVSRCYFISVNLGHRFPVFPDVSAHVM